MIKNFAGNRRVAERVEEMLCSKRLPHALLIEGEDGLGKHTLADIIAGSAVCTEDAIACGNCSGCRFFAAGTHPDVKRLRPEKSVFTVDAVRELRKDAYLLPALASGKIYIIEKADSMNLPAQNALLKILEEPPAGALFILLAVSAESLLPTVRSRCIILSLTPPTHDEAAEYISARGIYDKQTLDTALQESADNIGEALALLEKGQHNLASSTAAKLIDSIKHGGVYDMLLLLHPLEHDRAAAKTLFDELIRRENELVRESCVTHVKEGLTREQLIKLYDATVRLRERIDQNVNLPLLFACLCSVYKDI